MAKFIKNPIIRIIATSILLAFMICGYSVILFIGAFPKKEEIKEVTIIYPNVYMTP
jgi:hypothetical protein